METKTVSHSSENGNHNIEEFFSVTPPQNETNQKKYNRGPWSVKSAHELAEMDTLSQLRFLADMYEATHTNHPYYRGDAPDYVKSLQQDRDNFSPLIRILAAGLTHPSQQPLENAHTINDYFDPDAGYSAIASLYTSKEIEELEALGYDFIEQHLPQIQEKYKKQSIHYALTNLIFDKNQQKLHHEFPNIPPRYHFIKVASDAVVSFGYSEIFEDDDWGYGETFGRFITGVYDSNGVRQSIYMDQRPLGLTDEDFGYLNAIHKDDRMKHVINSALHTNITNVSLRSQLSLFRFMASSNNERFDNLQKTLQKIDSEPLKIKLLENFTAAEFGDDFGDALLDIANSTRFSGEQKEKILDNLTSARASLSKISGLFESFPDKNFAKSLTKASNERLTDIVTTFTAISKSGNIFANLGDYFGKAQFDYDSAIEALAYESKSLSIISDTIADVKNGEKDAFAEVVLQPSETRTRTMYNFYSPNHGYVLLYTRPEGAIGAFDPAFEYGKTSSRYSRFARNSGVEASISFIVNPEDPFALPNPVRPAFVKEPGKDILDKVSAIRLDREGRAPNSPALNPERDPISEIGTISVDLASINDGSDTPSGKIARLITVGNLIRQQKRGTSYSLNHNTGWFDQDVYGTASGFKSLVEHIDALATTWCKEHSPRSTKAESFYRLIHERDRKRGAHVVSTIEKTA